MANSMVKVFIIHLRVLRNLENGKKGRELSGLVPMRTIELVIGLHQLNHLNCFNLDFKI